MRVLDLFSGIGGFSLGLERAGMKTVAFCEIDPFCRRELAKHWPSAPCFNDVTTLCKDDLDAAGVGSIDIICGGFPCQDLSTAGPGSGLDGARSGLWREILRLVGELRPDFIILENSPELLDGWFSDVLGPMAALGYDAEWECIPAKVVGAPHDRDRVWVLAYTTLIGQSRPGGLLNAVHPTPDAFGEANRLVDAVQANALPFVCYRHDGVPPRLAQHQLAALGNAVVPLIPEIIGRAIMAAANPTRQEQAA